MPIIDAQVHLWSSGTPSGEHRQTSCFTAGELLAEMAEAGVDAAIIHPPSWDPDANALAIEAVQAHPGRFAILGQFPWDKPQERRHLEAWKDQPGMLGLRTALVMPHQKTQFEDGTMDWLWPELERLDIPFATMAWRFLPSFARVAERYPRLRLIIDHCGVVRSAKDDAAFSTVPQITHIARRFPNVAMKATGAPSYSTTPYPFRNIHDHLHRLYDAFGPDRFFWGTDITRMPCSYRQCVTMFTEELPWLSGHEQQKVMGDGIRAWLKWPEANLQPDKHPAAQRR